MQTPASISRHPVHPLLVVLPVGLWVFSLFCDLLYLGGAEAEIWSRLGDPHLAMAIALSVTGVGMLAVSSWLDATLVRVGAKK